MPLPAEVNAQFAEGVLSLERCIAITPSAANCYAGLGHALLQQGRAANPRQPVTLRSLAAAYAQSGKIADARRTLAELKEVAPHLPVANRRPPFDTIQPELNRGLRMAVEPRT
jgi:Flp pilus assembly protein TadD